MSGHMSRSCVARRDSDIRNLCTCRRKQELADKYCRRQAEDGVGDCSGLRLIPGMTRSGKQQTPEFLKGVIKTFGEQAE